jgi:antitoxin component of MazEF toxin-antitoxin module
VVRLPSGLLKLLKRGQSVELWVSSDSELSVEISMKETS